MNRKYIFIILFCFVINLSSQNKKILFGFNEVPQTLMANPGAEVDFQWHSGIPILSSNYIHAGISGFAINDIFANDGVNINTKIATLLPNIDNADFYTINQQLEVFNIGFRRTNKKDYISLGYYEEFDLIAYHPKDLVTLAYEGNQDLNKIFNLRDFKFKAEVLGVFHFGVSRKWNKKITIGARIKLYSSAFNITSTQNSGLFFTKEGTNNIYRHRMQEIDFTLKTSGVIHNEAEVEQSMFSRFVASGNMGLGLDFGLTYKINKNWITEASFQDLGFIRHTKNTTVYKVQGTQEYDGLNLTFPTGNPIDYLNQVKNELPLIYGSEKYTSLRSLKVNGLIAYQFGDRDNASCLRTFYENSFRSKIGLQIYSILRPKRPQFAATLFYDKKFSKFLRGKITYTVDSYSAKNIGIGLSTRIGVFNMYGAIDNILGLTNIAKSKNQTINFGINIIMDFDKTKP